YGLFASGAVTAPNSYKTRLNRAVSLFERDAMSDQAVAELERCLGILKSPPLSADQEDPGIYSNAAAIYGGRGDAVKRSGAPDAAQLSRAWYEKAMVVLRRGLAIDQARAVENEEANVKAGRPRAIFGVYEFYRELGKAYIRLGEPEKAIEPLDHASLIRPNAEIFQVFSEAYAAMHDSDGAAVALMEGQVIDPDQRGSASELVDLYKKMDPSGCAVTSAGGGNSLNIECPLVHRHLCAGVRRMAELYDRRYQPMEARRTRITGAQSFGCPAQ
ncbi:MAG TPA: hypothetical protein VGS58_03865, partial [Candidatus Sulfopaludibacter sp.]|nr:hypothetical protein [Candidatus Sulfopaludibacter sp.]